MNKIILKIKQLKNRSLIILLILGNKTPCKCNIKTVLFLFMKNNTLLYKRTVRI